MKQKVMLGVLTLGLAIVLAACGSSASSSGGSSSGGSSSSSSSSASGSDPASAAKGFYVGLYGDGQIDQFVCTSNKAAVDAIKQGVASSKSAMAASNASIDVS